jgi:hypothetical protein
MIALAQYVEGVFVMGRAVTKPIRKPAVASRTCAARHPYSYTNRPQMADCGGTLNENSRPQAARCERPLSSKIKYQLSISMYSFEIDIRTVPTERRYAGLQYSTLACRVLFPDGV